MNTKKHRSKSIVAPTAIDLFCGAGGLTYGLRSAGINVIAGIDIDNECAFPYEKNNDARFILRDVAQISGKEIASHYPEKGVRVLVGCAPCQDFSRYSQAKRARDSDRWALLGEFGRLVQEINPDIVSMENVIEIQSHQVFRDYCDMLRTLNYHLRVYSVNCAEYGIPQNRERTVLLASKMGEISLMPPQHNPVSVRAVIDGLEVLIAGGASKKDPLHRCSKISDLNLRRIQHSLPGGTWRDWPASLRAKCHQKESGRTYVSVYGRMEWDKPSPTLTTQFFGYGNGRFGHPEQDRAISLREGALLQSFPHDYQFVPPGKDVVFSTMGRLIGNAVPPRLGEVVGESIMQHLNQHRDNYYA